MGASSAGPRGRGLAPPCWEAGAGVQYTDSYGEDWGGGLEALCSQ